ncbi:YqgE/AlgH family protein [Haloferula helveola]|uniref:YqgE/AlgH family protein n=1 Tax=Haloferula helveola TaxID=490095 RepID=A0ABN6H8K2_9BACT|nr:YqgE/AlgH family protein [Haloferula helveola]
MPDAQIQLEGTLLLATPALRDGIFDRSVILLADHSAKEGAFGLILNHPTGHEVGHFLKQEEFSALERIPVHIGGPVSPEQLTFSAFWWNPHDGLHCQVRLPAEEAIQRTKQPGVLVRAFIGYSGWSAGQLEQELRRDSWITAKPNPELLGKAHDQGLWSELLRSMSPYHHILSEAPGDPGLN